MSEERPPQGHIWMANKYMNWFSTTLAIREIKIEVTMRYNTYVLKWLKLKTLTILSFGEEEEELELSYATVINAKWYN